MANPLPAGFRLEQYEIRGILRSDESGVEYEAIDRSTERRVTVEEFLPSRLAHRPQGTEVSARGPAEQSAFNAGLDRFLALYQPLEHIDHPAVVNVLGCLRANGTGYVVLEPLPEETLAERLEVQGTLPPAELSPLLSSVVNGLELVHRANLLHGDISPEHIAIRPDGKPLLFGFSVSRRDAGGSRQAFGSNLAGAVANPTPGYAALEQYSQAGREGPWTDIYGLAAVAYRCVTGEAPTDAPGRAVQDDLVPAVRAAKGNHNDRLLRGIDAALAIRAMDRPRSLGTWRSLLVDSPPAPTGPRGRMAARRSARVRQASKAGEARPNWALPAVGATLFIAVLTYVDTGVLRSTPEEAHAQVAESHSREEREPAAAEMAPASEPPDPAAVEVAQVAMQPLAPLDELADPGIGDEIDGPPVVDPTPSEPPVDVVEEQAETVAAVAPEVPEDQPASLEPIAEVVVRSEAAQQVAEPAPEQPAPTVAEPAPEQPAPTVAEPAPEQPAPAIAEPAPEQPAPAIAEPPPVAADPVVAETDAPAEPDVIAEPDVVVQPQPLIVTSVPTEFADSLASGGEGPVMVRIAPGGFRMGCVSGRRCFSNELPVQAVQVETGYAIAKHEITFSEYERFVEAAGYEWTEGSNGVQRGSHPVVNVSWADAVAYTEWLSAQTGRRYRLPTETEWEYAARAGSAAAYSWGNDLAPGRGNCAGCGNPDNARGTMPAGSFEANAWGLHDMHGNVWEWVLDCPTRSSRLAMEPGVNHQASAHCNRGVRRGGSWAHSPRRMRTASRDVTVAALRSPNTGFRVLLLNP